MQANNIIFTVIPIDFGCNIHYAVNEYNTSSKKELTDLDTRIMRALSTAARGTAAMKLREQVTINNKNIFSVVFNRAVNRLIECGFVTRAKWRKYVYYNITMKGRTALADINQILIDIVNKQMEERNKH